MDIAAKRLHILQTVAFFQGQLKLLDELDAEAAATLTPADQPDEPPVLDDPVGNPNG